MLIYDLDLTSLSKLLESWNEPSYRAKQIWQGLYQHFYTSPEQFSNLPKSLREKLGESVIFSPFKVKVYQDSSDGFTRKTLFELPDKNLIEAVLMRYGDPADNPQITASPTGRGARNRRTLCISTQAGCAMGCVFCATGQMGFKRHLSSGEIVAQVMYYAQMLKDVNESVTNIVFMGMGEPLANMEALSEAIRRLTNKLWGLGWSPRRITVSTAGLATRLKDIAPLGVNLAISLNATTDDQRASLMPAINRIASLKTLLTACRRYPLPPTRRLTFEYVLLAGVNDHADDARRLAKLVRGIACKINLIPFNEFPGSPFRRPSQRDISTFQTILRQANLDVFVRKSRGRDILGACGQLGNLSPEYTERALTQIESHC